MTEDFGNLFKVPRGRKLGTLEDAGNYITKIPEAEHRSPEWPAAMQARILVATHGGPTMLERISVMRALQPAKPKAPNSEAVSFGQ